MSTLQEEKVIHLHDQNFYEIRAKCLENRVLFEDPIFPAEYSSFYTKYNRMKPRVKLEWLRPGEISANPVLFADGISRFDAQQGALGNCWFIGSVSCFAAFRKHSKETFHRVVPEDQGFKPKDYAGIFHFRFWQFGEWVEVVVDDRLPTRFGNLVSLSSSDKSEYWTALLEKAYAKLYGSYEALTGGFGSEALVDFSGAFALVYPLSPGVDMFSTLLKACEDKALIGCCTKAKNDENVEEDDNKPNEDENKVHDDKDKVDEDKNKVDDKNKVTDDKNKVTDDKNKLSDDKNKVTDDKNNLSDGKNKVTDDKNNVTDDKNNENDEKTNKDGVNEEEENEEGDNNYDGTGLVDTHYYSITDVKTVPYSFLGEKGVAKMLRLRNPWGDDTEWTGAGSDESTEWNYIPQNVKDSMQLKVEADGEFWIPYKNMAKKFSCVEICWIPTDVKKKNVLSVHGKWNKGQGDGDISSNPQYVIKTASKKSTSVHIYLMDKHRRKRNPESPYQCLSLYACEYKPEPPAKGEKPKTGYLRTKFEEKDTIASNTYYMREITLTVTLEPKKQYVIVPARCETGEEAQYLLRVVHDHAVSMHAVRV